MSKLLLSILVALVAGCGAHIKKKVPDTQVKRGDSDLQRSLDCSAEGLQLDDSLLYRIPAEDVLLTKDEVETNLCAMLRQSSKPLTIVQFASVECYACQRWIDQIDSEIKAGGYIDIAHVVIFSSPVVVLPEENAKRLILEMAPRADYAMDYNGSAWRFFSPNVDAVDVVPMMVVMDSKARGFAVADAKKRLKAILTLANENLGINPVLTK